MTTLAKIPEKVLFLDRDGVINRDSTAYVKSCAEFEFLPGSLDAIRHLNRQGFKLVVITNQSAVGRHYISENGLKKIFDHMLAGVTAAGGHIMDIFYCPHTPEDHCSCRKPATGLLRQAQEKYGLDLAETWMIGDSAKDIECARNAGCGGAILVKTGNGVMAEQELFQRRLAPDHVAADLLAAARWIISQAKPSNSAS